MKTDRLGSANANLYRARQTELKRGGSQLVSPLYLAKAGELAQKFPQEADSRLVLKAYDLAWQGHLHQRRKQGTAFIVHPLSVAETLVKWGAGVEEVAAGLCHDLIEVGKINGQRVTKAMIAETLNKRVAAIVNGVTELGTEPGSLVTRPTQAEIWSYYLAEGLKDPSVFKVKLADRFNNMCTLVYTERQSHRAKAEETLYVYCRIADRLGMWRVKRQMEDLCFHYLYPARYNDLLARLRRLVHDSLPSVRTISCGIDRVLRPTGLAYDTQMEKRAVYELRERIRLRDLTEIGPADVWRLHVNLKNQGTDDCYRAFEALQKKHPFFPGESHDYIAQPLANGHRFLQTVLTGLPFNLAVQIRDLKMQRTYEVGTLEQDFSWVNNLRTALQTPNLDDSALYQLFARYA